MITKVAHQLCIHCSYPCRFLLHILHASQCSYGTKGILRNVCKQDQDFW